MSVRNPESTITRNVPVYNDAGQYIGSKKVEVDKLNEGVYPGDSDSIIEETGAALTLTSAHNGKTINKEGASSLLITVPGDLSATVPHGLPKGFVCQVVRSGTGNVSFTPQIPGGPTITSIGGSYFIADQYGSVVLQWLKTNKYNLG